MYKGDTCGELKPRLLGDVVVWMVNYYF